MRKIILICTILVVGILKIYSQKKSENFSKRFELKIDSIAKTQFIDFFKKNNKNIDTFLGKYFIDDESRINKIELQDIRLLPFHFEQWFEPEDIEKSIHKISNTYSYIGSINGYYSGSRVIGTSILLYYIEIEVQELYSDIDEAEYKRQTGHYIKFYNNDYGEWRKFKSYKREIELKKIYPINIADFQKIIGEFNN